MGLESVGAWPSTQSAMRAMLVAAVSLATLPSFATGLSIDPDPLKHLDFWLYKETAVGELEDAMARDVKDPAFLGYPSRFEDGFREYSVLQETYEFGDDFRGRMSGYADSSGTFWAETRGSVGYEAYADAGMWHVLYKTAPDAKLSMVITGGELVIGGNYDPDAPVIAEVDLRGKLSRNGPTPETSGTTYFGHKVRLCGAGGTFASETYGTCVNSGNLPADNVVYTESNLLAFKLDTVYQAKVEILPSVIDIDLSGIAIGEQFDFEVAVLVSTVIPLDAPESYAYAYLRDPLESGNADSIGSGIEFSGLTVISQPIPEPGTAALFLLGAALLGSRGMRGRARHLGLDGVE